MSGRVNWSRLSSRGRTPACFSQTCIVWGATTAKQPTPEAIRVFNKSHAKKIGLFHVTC
jgi:hypothetical protein